jgi:hypothetical protein
MFNFTIFMSWTCPCFDIPHAKNVFLVSSESTFEKEGRKCLYCYSTLHRLCSSIKKAHLGRNLLKTEIWLRIQEIQKSELN